MHSLYTYSTNKLKINYTSKSVDFIHYRKPRQLPTSADFLKFSVQY